MKIYWITLKVASIYFFATLTFASRTFASEVSNAENIGEVADVVIKQNTDINQNALIYQNTSDLHNLSQLSVVNQPSILTLSNILVEPKVFIEQPYFTNINCCLLYSLSAKDLQLDTSFSVSTQSLYYLSDIDTKDSPKEVTQQPNQPESASPDKSQYNLFNPTPRKLLRPFNPGRPSKTDTPFTVDAGHLQIESDLVTYTRDVNSTDGKDTKAYQIFIPNIRVGLLNNVDFQIQLQTYNNKRTRFQDGTEQVQSGYGDTTVGLRVNFWGNDGGQTALGMVTAIKFPTNEDNLGNNAIEGGITFPFAMQLSEQFNLGMQTEFALNQNNNSSGYNVGFINSAVLSYQATDKLSTFVEIFTNFTTESDSELVATFNTGVTYLLAENLQLDAGVNIGLTQASDDFNPFLGFSVRF